jgi:hypothetical protein
MVEEKKRSIFTKKVQKKDRPYKKIILAVVLVVVVFITIVMVKNSSRPAPLVIGKIDTKIKGRAFITTNQMLLEQAYQNWLPNDLFWPTVLLDNMPNFQIGELEVLRYNTRVLRDNLSRMRTTDKLDPSAEKVFTALSNDLYKWWLPSAESKLKLASKYLTAYNRNLTSGKSNFYPRSDNLIQLLDQYASLMGGVNTRLMNAPKDMRTVILFEDESKENQNGQKTIEVDIAWHQIDDNFYYAQGVAYALFESFKAIKTDFKSVLIDKNSLKLLEKIIENLRMCNFEPFVVFNGSTDSIFANHSLNLSGIFNDARQKINSLIVSLQKG